MEKSTEWNSEQGNQEHQRLNIRAKKQKKGMYIFIPEIEGILAGSWKF